jgi:hypothetical protein
LRETSRLSETNTVEKANIITNREGDINPGPIGIYSSPGRVDPEKLQVDPHYHETEVKINEEDVKVAVASPYTEG